MSEEALKDYLRQQARSFDSLLELTPAQNMFLKDNSDQWQRKKQTPEQKKAAKMAKLDPANWKSAKDVYDERSAEAAKKRKREVDLSEAQQDPPSTSEKPAKKQKSAATPVKSNPTEKLTQPIDPNKLENKNLKKRAKKRAAQREKNELKRQRKEQEKADRQTALPNAEISSTEVTVESSNKKDKPQKTKTVKTKPQTSESQISKTDAEAKSKHIKPIKGVVHAQEADGKKNEHTKQAGENEEEEDDWSDIEADTTLEPLRTSTDQQSESEGDEDVDMDDSYSTATSSDAIPDIMSPPHESAASSVSSVLPLSKSDKSHSSESHPDSQSTDSPSSIRPIQTEADRQAARQRLQEQISQFRSQRKADDRPVRSRADLLAQRRQKEQEKKQLKKEQRRKEKEEEARQQDEEIARRFSPGGSGSLLASPRSPMIDDGGSNAFSFGRIAFEDGSAFDPSKNTAADQKKHRGPADPATALKAAKAKQARISGLDEQKRKDIEEKDMWLNAKKKAHGERVKDDTSLLKKALKRQEKQKQRSEKDWNERTEGVRSSQEARQKKRTENLQKRKDDKLSRKVGGGKKKVKRPGFEGSFRGRSGKGGKK